MGVVVKRLVGTGVDVRVKVGVLVLVPVVLVGVLLGVGDAAGRKALEV